MKFLTAKNTALTALAVFIANLLYGFLVGVGMLNNMAAFIAGRNFNFILLILTLLFLTCLTLFFVCLLSGYKKESRTTEAVFTGDIIEKMDYSKETESYRQFLKPPAPPADNPPPPPANSSGK